jgi:hypothetical protein
VEAKDYRLDNSFGGKGTGSVDDAQATGNDRQQTGSCDLLTHTQEEELYPPSAEIEAEPERSFMEFAQTASCKVFCDPLNWAE